ncbi:DNA mismatch repair endonuclease MutL [Robertmurraya yapensis]|uniref:DNA mismatch repair protein MutL n=2 Tax=Bacillaceae TaxID=186817 RepID=A0A431WJA2_9BACI|nr:DNA mismatch repair endonuclease MutL [Bacillus yapensis]RTR35661.1 DNA mismatch repair endonuclease MutL [Bacillus yapensis]TKS98462.1 DNA mismatch repair endonuclease MutL [Bacillus yapensis]
MGKIIQLDDLLSNKIAAGEVVERPASVVKELVENAIDANSTIIEIEVEEAGLSKIRIIDNGDGIEESDVLMAFRRHATSKIKDDKDLFRIRTLGFRGEALPSIASVSRLELKTSTGEEGTRLVLAGGHIEVHEKASARKGTDIQITDLFYNTPARLKYMKTVHTELGNITDIVNRLALSHPEVSFRLVHNDRKLLHTNGNGDVRQVLAAIYGLNIVKKMIPIHASSLDFTISGWLAYPEITRASRNYITTMVNGRFIKNYPLVKAIQEGYHTLLPIGRFPIVMINIEMDPILVDVNVHPSKMEVRFSKEAELNQLVAQTIKEAFHTKELIPTGMQREPKEVIRTEQPSFDLDHLPIAKEEQPPIEYDLPEIEPYSPPVQTPFVQKMEWTVEMKQEETSVPTFSEPVLEKEEEVPAPIESRVPPLYPIGQMHGTYIFAQNEKGLYIIDQHAAQERIKYEYFREKVGRVEKELQEMLVPLTFEYSSDETIKIMEHKDKLEEVGVFLEPFGINSFIVRSHPQWFPKGEEKETIEEMIEQLLTMKKVDIKKLREEAAIMMSCKGSIKANHYLQTSEIQALLDELRRSSDPFTCPHGRPIIIHYSTYDMEKMFKRVM